MTHARQRSFSTRSIAAHQAATATSLTGFSWPWVTGEPSAPAMRSKSITISPGIACCAA